MTPREPQSIVVSNLSFHKTRELRLGTSLTCLVLALGASQRCVATLIISYWKSEREQGFFLTGFVPF